MRQHIAAIVIHQTPESPRNMRAGKTHTTQPTAKVTVNQNADTSPDFKEDSVTRIDSPCYPTFVLFFVRIPDPIVAGESVEKLRQRQNQYTHHKLSMQEPSQPCGQANSQLPPIIPTPVPPKESHGPSDTPERSETSATFDVDSNRTFHETSDNVPQWSFSTAAATVAQRTGGECRSVTELSQSATNQATVFPGIGMERSSIGNSALALRRCDGQECPSYVKPRSTPSYAASVPGADSGDSGFRILPPGSSVLYRRSCRRLSDRMPGYASQL